MNPSLQARERAATSGFMNFEELSLHFRENDLSPKDGRFHRVEGKKVAAVLGMETFKEVEAEINEMVFAIKNSVSQAEVSASLDDAIVAAEGSTDPFQLSYLASMFIHHREVMRAVARNQHIDEGTQMILASDLELRRDKAVQMALGGNPSLIASVARKMIMGNTDPYVENAITATVSKKSVTGPVDSEFAQLCKELARFYDPLTRATALKGVQDPEVLRIAADSNSLILGSKDLEAVATNKFTPDDVLAELSNRRVLGLPNSVTIKARNQLQRRTQTENYSPQENNPFG